MWCSPTPETVRGRSASPLVIHASHQTAHDNVNPTTSRDARGNNGTPAGPEEAGEHPLPTQNPPRPAAQQDPPRRASKDPAHPREPTPVAHSRGNQGQVVPHVAANGQPQRVGRNRAPFGAAEGREPSHSVPSVRPRTSSGFGASPTSTVIPSSRQHRQVAGHHPEPRWLCEC